MFKNVGFIGSGPLTQALAHHLVAAQIPVLISNSRGPDSLTELVAQLGETADAVTVERAADADVVILALPFVRVPELAQVVPDWTGRIVIDATNQFAEYTPTYRGHVDLGEETGSEWVARHLPGATIIKAFNAMYATYLSPDPRHHDGRQVVAAAGPRYLTAAGSWAAQVDLAVPQKLVLVHRSRHIGRTRPQRAATHPCLYAT
jgi:predicted dinucleotide-binding enzyme